MSFFDVYALIALFTFSTLLLSKTILTKVRGKQVIALGKGKTGVGKFIEYFYYFGFVFLSYLVIVGAFKIHFIFIGELIIVFKNIYTDIIGFVFLNISIILFAFTLASFKDAWRIGVAINTTESLITSGVFKYTRNPTYIAIISLFLGYFLIYSNFFFLGALIFIVISFVHQIKKEEQLLEKIFQDNYLEYKNSTPRIFSIKKLFREK